MSELEVLIQQCCPDGVRVVELGTFAKAEVGKNKGCTCNRAYSITQKGLIPTSEYFKEAKVTSEDTSGYKIVKKHWFVYSPSRIDVGSINYLQDEEDVIVSPLNIVFSINENIIDAKYLLAFLNSRKGTWQILSKREGIEGTGRKMLPFAKFSTIEVPVPPLEVQREIVRILDQFTELTAELIAELTARKRQYEYYQQKIFDFDDSNIEWTTLSQIADIGTGSSNTNEELEDGKYPFFVRSQEVRRKNTFEYDETAIITSGDGVGVGKIFHYVEGKYALHQRAYRIHITDKRVLPKFYFYYMKSSFLTYIEKASFHSSVTSIRRPMLNNFPVPIPSIEEQRRVVFILDRFDTLCNDLTSGLPAEIEARQKQYEYYRDKLLTFRRSGANE